jgi:O-antigen/teichoic acid export membrane protein
LGQFTRNVSLTIVSKVLTLVIGVGTSVLIARALGPEGKGVYAMAMLLPTLIVTLSHLGIGLASVYYVAQQRYPCKEILGNNIILAAVISGIGVSGGLIVSVFFGQAIFAGVAKGYLLLALAIMPINFFFVYLENILLGTQRIKKYNYLSILHTVLFFSLIVLSLWVLKISVVGAILAGILAWLLTDVVLFLWVREVAGGVSFKWNREYIKQASTYGIKAHLGNILGFLNLRLDMFLVNAFLNPVAVGFYSIGVGLVEKLWLISQAAGTVLLPKVAAEMDEQRRKEFTPLAARTVLWITALGALVLVFLSRWIVVLLYSEDFLPSVNALQALLVGIVVLGPGRVLANDIAGRGRPMLNTYVGMPTLVTNLILNVFWIPRYGITGAAWASTVSYSLTLVARLFLYCRISGNSWTKVVFPQRGDWTLYRRTGVDLEQWVRTKMKAAL